MLRTTEFRQHGTGSTLNVYSMSVDASEGQHSAGKLSLGHVTHATDGIR